MLSENPQMPMVPSVAVLVIGNEVLSGRTKDVNLAMLATHLFAKGFRLIEARVVPDVKEAIVEALNALRVRATYVFTTGGIGPTHDDITVESVAAAFGVPVVELPEAFARLVAHYGEAAMNPARRRMALAPRGATIIDNPLTGAPGLHIGNVFIMAGVPAIAQAMTEAALRGLPDGVPLHSLTLTCTVLESLLADELRVIARDFADIDIGSYPHLRDGQPSLSLVMKGDNCARLEACAEALAALIRAHGGEPARSDA
jgi:molybdenum cofactor synthesis domain-containing protein